MIIVFFSAGTCGDFLPVYGTSIVYVADNKYTSNRLRLGVCNYRECLVIFIETDKCFVGIVRNRRTVAGLLGIPIVQDL